MYTCYSIALNIAFSSLSLFRFLYTVDMKILVTKELDCYFSEEEISENSNTMLAILFLLSKLSLLLPGFLCEHIHVSF
jgi:hypothetical protein